MTVVAIHQPNYAPWLGYFHKLAQADVFVFLDDAQFSKGSYTNRVQIAAGGTPSWLTIPVHHALGTRIDRVEIARQDWARAHLDRLRNSYAATAQFKAVWPDIAAIYQSLSGSSLADTNMTLIAALAERLGIGTPTRRASDLDCSSQSGDDRLVAMCRKIGDNVTYLSGKGGASYQDEAKFRAASIDLNYSGFRHPVYPTGEAPFVPGLSILDAVFHLGWDGAARLVTTP